MLLQQLGWTTALVKRCTAMVRPPFGREVLRWVGDEKLRAAVVQLGAGAVNFVQAKRRIFLLRRRNRTMPGALRPHLTTKGFGHGVTHGGWPVGVVYLHS